MATAAQIAAKRRNARKSSGATTAAGKAASSRNALRHGLTARRDVVFEEDAGDLQRLQAAMRADLAPRNRREALLVEAIGHAALRLRRAAKAEAALFNRANPWFEVFSHPRELDLLARYEAATERTFLRALAMLERGHERPESVAHPPPYPPPQGRRGDEPEKSEQTATSLNCPSPLEGENG